MMLANKENAVLHPPQHGKANPKTPALGKMATKTPFKIPLNDENTTAHPKAGKNLFAGRDPSQFVTPVGPRRQALAGKTTNAKARPLALPVQQGKTGQKHDGAIKPQRTRFALAQQPEVVHTEEGDDVPEIEYMAPVPPEITFVPEGFEEPDYGFLKKNYMKNCHQAYLTGLDEDGKTEIQRKMEKGLRLLDDELDAETEEAISNAKGIRKPKATSLKTDVPARDTGATVKKIIEGKRSTARPGLSRQPSNARPTSRPTSSASVARPTSSSGPIVRSISSSQRQAASTLDSRKAAEAFSQCHSRPTSSTSNLRPESRVSLHSRSVSTTMEPKKLVHSHTPSVVTKSTIGYTTGQNLCDNVKKMVSRAKLESALDAIERIQREDEEAEAQFVVHVPEDVYDGNDDDVIVGFPSLLIEDEEEFFMTMPE